MYCTFGICWNSKGCCNLLYEQYSLVSISNNNRSGDNKTKLAVSVEKVENEINAFARTVEQTQYELKINQNEKEIFDLDMKIEHPDNKLPAMA